MFILHRLSCIIYDSLKRTMSYKSFTWGFYWWPSVFDSLKRTWPYESLNWESDFSSCTVCSWLAKKNQMIRVIYYRIKLCGYPVCFWFTKMSRTIFNCEADFTWLNCIFGAEWKCKEHLGYFCICGRMHVWELSTKLNVMKITWFCYFI